MMEHKLWFMGTSYVPGEARSLIDNLKPSAHKEMVRAEFYYFQGESKQAAELSEQYLQNEDPVLRLSACLIYIFSDFSLGRVEAVKAGIHIMKGTGEMLALSDDCKERAYAAFAGSVARVLLHIKGWQMPLIIEYLTDLPKGLSLWGCYFIAYDAYQKGEYERSRGIVETGLAFSPQLYPVPFVYLHLVAAMDAVSLKKMKEASEHFHAAWKLAEPDGLLEALGEHHGLLQGMIEEYIKEKWPEKYSRIFCVMENFSYGWQRWHGLGSEGEGAKATTWKLKILTKEEFVIATLANRGWMNAEIAAHMGVEQKQIDRQLKVVYRKLGVTNRRQLKKYMLQ